MSLVTLLDVLVESIDVTASPRPPRAPHDPGPDEDLPEGDPPDEDPTDDPDDEDEGDVADPPLYGRVHARDRR